MVERASTDPPGEPEERRPRAARKGGSRAVRRVSGALIGTPSLRVYDLRHTAASIWLAQGADPKVVQRVLGHATASMTMDLYGHLVDVNLWDAANRIGGISGAFPGSTAEDEEAPGQ